MVSIRATKGLGRGTHMCVYPSVSLPSSWHSALSQVPTPRSHTLPGASLPVRSLASSSVLGCAATPSCTEAHGVPAPPPATVRPWPSHLLSGAQGLPGAGRTRQGCGRNELKRRQHRLRTTASVRFLLLVPRPQHSPGWWWAHGTIPVQGQGLHHMKTAGLTSHIHRRSP